MASRVIDVVEHDPNWSIRFMEERQRLHGALDGVAHSIEHIGSTAVPGLAAKPIIDLLLEVDSLAELDARTPALEELGYLARGENGIPGRRYFCKGGVRRTHHLHAFEIGDPHATRHRVFRDYLVANPAVARAYADLKRQAAASNRNDAAGYTAWKDDFVQNHLQCALNASGRGD